MKFIIYSLAGSLLMLLLVITACGGVSAPKVVSQLTPLPEPVIRDFPGEGVQVQPARAGFPRTAYREAAAPV